MSTIVVLDNIRSAQNVGAIFRTCDGAGVAKVYLVGYTPGPRDRFGRVQPAIAKTSLGAAEHVASEQVSDAEVVERIAAYKNAGYEIVAVEQGEGSTMLSDWKPKNDQVLIFGNEVEGVATALCAVADTLLELPMRGHKESLNVSVTAGAVLYRHL